MTDRTDKRGQSNSNTMKYFFFFFILYFTKIYAQQGNVLDAVTKTPLEGAYIVALDSTNKVLAVTNQKGDFKLDMPITSDSAYISYIGYRTYGIKISNFPSEIFLTPLNYELPTFLIEGNKKGKKAKIGSLKGRSTNYHIAYKSVCVASHLQNTCNNETILLKWIKLKFTNSNEVCLYPVRIHLFSVNKSKFPDIDIIHPVIYDLKKREEIYLDISNYGITLPCEGIFVGIEWLVEEDHCKSLKYGPSLEVLKEAPDQNNNIYRFDYKKKNWHIDARIKGRFRMELGVKIF